MMTEADKTPEMYVYKDVRYRYEDARRLGLITDGKVITHNSVERAPRRTVAPSGLVKAEGETEDSDKSAAGESQPEDDESKTPDSSEDEGTVVERPKRSASKDAWTKYALDNGIEAADLEGLSRDQISELFADEK